MPTPAGRNPRRGSRTAQRRRQPLGHAAALPAGRELSGGTRFAPPCSLPRPASTGGRPCGAARSGRHGLAALRRHAPWPSRTFTTGLHWRPQAHTSGTPVSLLTSFGGSHAKRPHAGWRTPLAWSPRCGTPQPCYATEWPGLLASEHGFHMFQQVAEARGTRVLCSTWDLWCGGPSAMAPSGRQAQQGGHIQPRFPPRCRVFPLAEHRRSRDGRVHSRQRRPPVGRSSCRALPAAQVRRRAGLWRAGVPESTGAGAGSAAWALPPPPPPPPPPEGVSKITPPPRCPCSAAQVTAARPASGSLVQCLRDNSIDVLTGADYPAYLEASQVHCCRRVGAEASKVPPPGALVQHLPPPLLWPRRCGHRARPHAPHLLMQTFSKLFRNWPSAIAYPNNTEHVAAAVKCAIKYSAAVHPRCGGHGNEGAAAGGGMRMQGGQGWAGPPGCSRPCRSGRAC